MATNEEVLRAFVVSLGWKNEAAQQKEFVGAVESATIKANSPQRLHGSGWPSPKLICALDHTIEH
jgi:hypothetical protein